MSASVAIVLSNFNHAAYLPDSLSGICGQTRPADDIVVIDDGSTDNSLDVINDFASRYLRIRLVSNPGNLGLQESIARALPSITADYVVWAASDDRLLPQFLEKSMAALERHPEAGLCFSELSVLRGNTGRIERFAENPDIAHIFDLSDLPEVLTPAALEQRMRSAYLPMTSNSVVVRRAALLAVGGYAKELEWYADSFAYTVVALRYGACVVPETLALIRANPESYSERGRRGPREVEVLRNILDRLARQELRDIRRAFRRCPSNFAHWGIPMLRLQLRRARDWDLFVAYFLWKSREFRSVWNLSWPAAVVRLIERDLLRVPVLSHGVRAIRFGIRLARAFIRRTRIRRLAATSSDTKP